MELGVVVILDFLCLRKYLKFGRWEEREDLERHKGGEECDIYVFKICFN